MNLKISVAAAALACTFGLAVATAASATVVNFDDLTGSGNLADGYAGLTWNNDFSYYDSPQDPFNPSSPNTRVYSNYGEHGPGTGDPLIVNFGGTATFNGAYFAGLSGGTVHFELYLAGLLVHTSGDVFTSGTPTFLDAGYGGNVDEVRVLGLNGYYVMDDFTYNGGAAPEPAAWALMIGGFGLAGAGLRRRKAVAA
jgi:hypothetical protein